MIHRIYRGVSVQDAVQDVVVPAIGLVVDDAIVVIENVAEEGPSPRDATRKSMDQITGALVGIALESRMIPPVGVR